MSNRSSYDFIPRAVRGASRDYDFTPLAVQKANPNHDDRGRFSSGTIRGSLSGNSAEDRATISRNVDQAIANRGETSGERLVRQAGERYQRSLPAKLGRLLTGAHSGAKKLFGKRSKHYTAAMRNAAEARGHTMPGGGFPIDNLADLARAKRAVGRARDPVAARAWINRRAKQLGAAPLGKAFWPVYEVPAPMNYLPLTLLKSVSPDLEKGLVWGWASVIEKDGKVITDHQDDRISEDELMKAAHDYITNCRVGGALHIFASEDGSKTPLQCGDVVESMVMTKDLQKALGIDLGKVGWLIGYQVTNPEVRKAFARGDLKAFSIGGHGIRVPVEE